MAEPSIYKLSEISACTSILNWVKLAAESGKLSEDLDVVGKITKLDVSMLNDVGKAWELNGDVEDFRKLLKGLSFTPDYPVQGKNFYDLLHKCVESGDIVKVRFLERGYGWIAEIRTMELEPGQKVSERVGSAFSFIESIVDSLDGDRLNKISEILDNPLESREKNGAYKEMLRLKSHLFGRIGLSKNKQKAWLMDEYLEKWSKASKLGDAIVSYLIDRCGWLL